MFVQGGLVKYQASQIHNNAMFGSDGGAPVLTNDVSLQVFMEYLNARKLKLLVKTGAPPSSPNMALLWVCEGLTLHNKNQACEPTFSVVMELEL